MTNEENVTQFPRTVVQQETIHGEQESEFFNSDPHEAEGAEEGALASRLLVLLVLLISFIGLAISSVALLTIIDVKSRMATHKQVLSATITTQEVLTATNNTIAEIGKNVTVGNKQVEGAINVAKQNNERVKQIVEASLVNPATGEATSLVDNMRDIVASGIQSVKRKIVADVKKAVKQEVVNASEPLKQAVASMPDALAPVVRSAVSEQNQQDREAIQRMERLKKQLDFLSHEEAKNHVAIRQIESLKQSECLDVGKSKDCWITH